MKAMTRDIEWGRGAGFWPDSLVRCVADPSAGSMARVYHERSADREYARDLSTVGARLSGMVRFRTDAACAGSVTDEMPANLPFRL
jgi:hypothetical protein